MMFWVVARRLLRRSKWMKGGCSDVPVVKMFWVVARRLLRYSGWLLKYVLGGC